MIPKFTSKEIHFLKTDSDADICPPDTFLSDILHEPTLEFDTLCQRMATTMEDKNAFVASVFQVDTSLSVDQRDKVNQIFESCFNSLMDKERGIWERLDDFSFALAYWDFDTIQKARRILITLQETISTTLETPVKLGTCFFPAWDFNRDEILANAVKALDHAAFFKGGHHQEFDATSLNICGDRRYQVGDHDRAILEYEKGLEMEPKNVNLLNSLGVCFGVMGELEKAGEIFEKTLALNPSEIMVIYNMGLIHQINHQPEKAILFLRKAHGIDPQIFEVELLLGHLLFKNKNHQDALPHLEKAAQLKPESSLALTIKADILLEQEELQRAGQIYGRAIKNRPGNARAISGYALSMALQGKNMGIALSFARESTLLDPESKLFRTRLNTIKALAEQKEKDASAKSA